MAASLPFPQSGRQLAPKCTPGHCRASKTTVWVADTAVLLLVVAVAHLIEMQASAVGGGVGFGGGALHKGFESGKVKKKDF